MMVTLLYLQLFEFKDGDFLAIELGNSNQGLVEIVMFALIVEEFRTFGDEDNYDEENDDLKQGRSQKQGLHVLEEVKVSAQNYQAGRVKHQR